MTRVSYNVKFLLSILPETECKEENEEQTVYIQAVHQQYMSKQITFFGHRQSERQDSSPCSAYHHWALPVK